MATKDIIDTLAGIEPGTALDGIRARRLQARENAQKAISRCSSRSTPAIFRLSSAPQSRSS